MYQLAPCRDKVCLASC